MSEKQTQDESTSAAPESVGGSQDLLSGLEDLLEEEGVDLDEEDDVGEDDLDDLFDGEEEEDEEEESVSAPSSSRQRVDSRSARTNRRNQDRQAFQNLESQMRLDPMGIEIAEDKLVATISRFTEDNTYEETLQLLAENNIVSGIDHEGIRAALAKAARGQPIYGVVVAKGSPPRVVKSASIKYHLPEEMLAGRSAGAKTTDFERLKQILEGPHAEAIHSWQGVVKVVRKGDMIAELVPAELEPGENIFGEPVDVENLEDLELDFGDNTVPSEDDQSCIAEIYGFAGLIEGQPTVLPPVWTGEDHMEARFVYFTSPEPIPAPSIEDLEQLLELKWIEFGEMKTQLELIQKRLARGQSLSPTLPIAQGLSEISGENAQIQYAFDTFSLLSWSQIQSLWGLPTPEAIETTLTDLYTDSSTPRMTAFRPGEVVVEKIPSTEGVPGKDIQGEDIIPEEGQDVELEVGENMVITEDDLRALANCFGYACLQFDIQTTLFPPLWITPEKSAAYFINLPQTGLQKHPSLEEMQELLEQFKITHGFLAERWVEKLAELEAGALTDFAIPVAEGTPAQPGQDANFDWAIEITDRKPGKVLDDGSIDFRERNLTTVVKEGDLIGRLVPPKQGVPGEDIFGSELIPPQPINIEVITDSRISAEAEEDGSISFFADIGGGISSETQIKEKKNSSSKRISIGIYPISNIEKDVDYSTGNIDFNGDVVIGGSVQPQFSVRATGSVTIGGYVETGAYITAGKDIMVKSGVVGASTELVAGGDIMAKYIQEATIRARKDVKAGSYIFNASVRSGGLVTVTGKGEGKSRALVGGLIWGARGVVARSIGSPYNTNTRLVAGIDPEFVTRADQIRANIQACEEKQRKIMKGIGIESMDLEIIKQKIARSRDPKEKKKILVSLKRIAKVAELEQNLQKELAEIAENQRQLSFRTSVNVQNELFAGVELRIGEQTLVLQDDENKVSFRLVQEDDELEIQKAPFSGNLR